MKTSESGERESVGGGKSVESSWYELHASLRSPRCDRVISDDRLLIIPRLTSMTRVRARAGVHARQLIAREFTSGGRRSLRAASCSQIDNDGNAATSARELISPA